MAADGVRTTAAEAARPAAAADVAEVRRLAGLAAVELEPLRGGGLFLAGDPGPLGAAAGGDDAVASAIADPDHGVWIGTLDDVPVGYAAAHLKTLSDGRRLAVATDLFVEPGARAVGVGEALAGEVMAWAKGLGAVGVDAWALPGARETKNFFEEQGFTARLLTMHHRFGPRP